MTTTPTPATIEPIRASDTLHATTRRGGVRGIRIQDVILFRTDTGAVMLVNADLDPATDATPIEACALDTITALRSGVTRMIRAGTATHRQAHAEAVLDLLDGYTSAERRVTDWAGSMRDRLRAWEHGCLTRSQRQFTELLARLSAPVRAEIDTQLGGPDARRVLDRNEHNADYLMLARDAEQLWGEHLDGLRRLTGQSAAGLADAYDPMRDNTLEERITAALMPPLLTTEICDMILVDGGYDQLVDGLETCAADDRGPTGEELTAALDAIAAGPVDDDTILTLFEGLDDLSGHDPATDTHDPTVLRRQCQAVLDRVNAAITPHLTLLGRRRRELLDAELAAADALGW